MRAHMITWFGASFLATVLGTGCQQQSLRNDFEVQSPPVPNLSASVTSQRPPRNSETALPPSEPGSPVRGTVLRVEFGEPDATSQAAAAPGLSDTKQDQACSRDAAEKPSAGKATSALISGTSSRCTGAEHYVMAAGPALPGSESPAAGQASDKPPAAQSVKDMAAEKRLDSKPEEMRIPAPMMPAPELRTPGKVAEKPRDSAGPAPEKRPAVEPDDKPLVGSSSNSTGPELANLDTPAEKVSANPLATAEEHLQAQAAEQSPATGGAARASGGHAADYRWVCGELQYSPFDKTWRVRYARFDEVDPYGGSVTIVDEAHAQTFKEGQIVRVEGRLIRAKGNSIAPRYEVRSLRVIADKE
jgi:hypothetical protein